MSQPNPTTTNVSIPAAGTVRRGRTVTTLRTVARCCTSSVPGLHTSSCSERPDACSTCQGRDPRCMDCQGQG